MDGTRTAVESQRERAPDVASDRGRVIVERVTPEIDAGRFPIKRSSGERVTVSADIFADGHDVLAGVVRYRYLAPMRPSPGSKGPGLARREPDAAGRVLTDPPEWQEVPLTPRDND